MTNVFGAPNARDDFTGLCGHEPLNPAIPRGNLIQIA